MGGGSGSGFEVPGGDSVPAAPSGAGRGGAGSGFEVPGGGPATPQHGGGGLLHDIGGVFTGGAHFAASKLERGAADIKQIGTGMYDIGKVAVQGLYKGDPNAGAEWSALFHGHPGRMWQLQHESEIGREQSGAITALTKGQFESLKGVVQHPLRDPVMDAIWLAPTGHVLAKGGLKAVGRGALLETPRMLAEPGRRPVSVFTSKNAGRRLVQAGIDKAVNHALANERGPGFVGHEGKVAKYGRSRMGGTLAEIGRTRIRFRQALIASTRIAGRQVGQFAKSLGHEIENPQLVTQALLHALHDNQLPEHEAIFHEQQAAKGINPEQNAAWARAFNDAARLDVVRLDAADRVTIDEAHPLAQPLARADSALEKIGAYGEEQLVARGLREPHDLEDRKARVSQLVQRGRPLRGAEPQALSDARRSLVNKQKAHEKSLKLDADWRAGRGQKTVGGHPAPPGPNLTAGGKIVEGTPEAANPYRNRVVDSGQKLEEARSRVQELEDRHGYSSPERRAAIKQGIQAREHLHETAHSLLGSDAAAYLQHVEGTARQYARANDVTPHEFYAHHLSSVEAATPEALAHEALQGVRQSLSPVVEEIARKQYVQGDVWTREGEEAFVDDMLKAGRGEHVDPVAQRLYTMTSHWIRGRGYVPMTVWEDVRKSNSPMASSVGSVAGEAKSPMNSHFATGEATAKGLRRTDVVESVAAHWQKMMRFFNTLDHRELASQHGSDTRLSASDMLVRYDRRTEAGFKLPAGRIDETIKEALGVLENKTGLPGPEEEGLSAGVGEALRDVVGHIFPRLGTDVELRRLEDTAARGDAAPAGYKWVPEQLVKLKDLESALGARDSNPVGRFADNVNGAVTAATVYYKIGHVTTRVMTNAATNVMQGSMRPSEMAMSWDTFHKLTHEEQQEALAYAGTHYYEAAPGATGSTVVGKGMQKGLHIPFTEKALRTRSGAAVMSPQWWAHHIDAPFRFNSIAFEARRAGYDGAEGFRSFLQDVRDFNTLDDTKRAEVEGVLRRADREAIAYDRLNQFEKRFLTRMVWFYPWIKGSTVFTGNTLLEHPFKAALVGSLGQQGDAQTTHALGDFPSYAHGLTELTHGQEPVVTDLNTFNPFSTAADLLGTPEHLQELGGMANPAIGAAVGAAQGVNPYGARTPSPIWDNVKGLVSSAPEYQIANAALDHADQSHRLYPGGHGLDPLYKNWLGMLVRGLVGPAAPRHVNPDAGHSLAERERTGR